MGSRVDEAGRGFAVVTDEVRKLSTETANAVAQISHGIKHVTETIIEQFQEKLTNETIESERHALERFANQLNLVEERYAEMTNQQYQILGTITQNSHRLGNMFVQVMSSVQFQDVVRQQLGQVTHAIMHIDQHLSRLAEALRLGDENMLPPPITHRFESVLDKHIKTNSPDRRQVMTDQDTAEVKSPPRIELF